MARGDLNDRASLEAAFDDVDVVYYLVHLDGVRKGLRRGGASRGRERRRGRPQGGVRRIIYLSGIAPGGAELSTHLSSRTRVGEILIASGIETIVLQAGVVVGSGSASFEMIRHLTDRLPVMTTPKWVHNKIQPIAIRDVLHYLVAAATAQVLDLAGVGHRRPRRPRVRRHDADLRRGRRSAAQAHAGAAGVDTRIAALWVGLVTPIPSGLARPLVESLHCDAVMDNHDIDTIIPPPPGGLTPTGSRCRWRWRASRAATSSRRGTPAPRRNCRATRSGRARWCSSTPGPGTAMPARPTCGRPSRTASRSAGRSRNTNRATSFACAPRTGTRRALAGDAGHPGGQRQPLRAAHPVLSARIIGPGVLVRRAAGADARLPGAGAAVTSAAR